MLELSPLERSFLQRSADTAVTKRRNRMALVTGGILITSFTVAAVVTQSLVLIIVVAAANSVLEPRMIWRRAEEVS